MLRRIALFALFGWLLMLGTLTGTLPCEAQVTQPEPMRPEEVFRAAFESRFDRDWFNDVNVLNQSWLATHANYELPAHKLLFCAERSARVIHQRLFSGRVFRDVGVIRVPSTTLAFSNPPGPVGRGMCWLHSRLQREFTYLANFRPDIPRPVGREEAEEIIYRISAQHQVAEIPGFRDLNEFSVAFRDLLLARIDRMGWACVFDPADCASRLGDSYTPSVEEVRSVLDTLHSRMIQQPGDIQFLRLRIRSYQSGGSSNRDTGIPIFDPVIREVWAQVVAHSLLVVSMTPIVYSRLSPPVGYAMQVLDPGDPKTIFNIRYLYGDVDLQYGANTMIPILHDSYAGDIPEMNRAIDEYCRE